MNTRMHAVFAAASLCSPAMGVCNDPNGTACVANSPVAKDQLLLQAMPARLHRSRVSGNNVVLDNAAGGWGGSCTCPDGQVYYVGDNHDACGSLACVGGTPGVCEQRVDAMWNGKKVECAPPQSVPAPAPPTGDCQPSEVQRRRRDVSMCSCRRRHGAADLASGWACVGNGGDGQDLIEAVEPPAPMPAPAAGNAVFDNVDGIGGHGGSCTCPDGSVYWVGDNNNGCATLACVGGTPGKCNNWVDDQWARRKVICAPKAAWTVTGQTVAHDCYRDEFRVEVPSPSFTLKNPSCTGSSGNVEVKVLTYNLWWWNLYGHRGGNDNSAGKLIIHNGPFDIIGFQEIDDAQRILNDAGMANTHTMVKKHGWPHNNVAIAYMHTRWEKVAEGWAPVGHDKEPQNYGYRGVNWVRLRHKATGKTVFFQNHHGPLPINTGGDCGGEAVAYNMLKVIANFAENSDLIVSVGDFNAEKMPHTSQTVGALEKALYLNFYNWVDNIFSSCENAHSTRNLGTGGSDHPALEAVYKI